MCGRFYIEKGFDAKLAGMLRRERIRPPVADPYSRDLPRDVAPTEPALVIHGSYASHGEVVSTVMRWGFASPYGGDLIINARAETAPEKKTFSRSLQTSRCLIPVSGFYEWGEGGAKYRFHRKNDWLLLLAGIYREEKDGPRYTILTTEANESVGAVHPRMPLLIGPGEIRTWIFDDTRLPELLTRPQKALHREQDTGQISMGLGF